MENDGKIELTLEEKEIVEVLNDQVYTVPYLEERINRNDNVTINAVAALTAMGAKGYYKAVQHMSEKN